MDEKTQGTDPNRDAAPHLLGPNARVFIVAMVVSFGYGGSNGDQPFYGWRASCPWHMAGSTEPDVMEGTIQTRHAVPELPDAIDYVLNMCQRFGVMIGAPMTDRKLWLMYDEAEISQAPADWRDTLKVEAERRGWNVELRPDLSET